MCKEQYVLITLFVIHGFYIFLIYPLSISGIKFRMKPRIYREQKGKEAYLLLESEAGKEFEPKLIWGLVRMNYN